MCLFVCFRHWRNTALWLTARHLFEFTEQLWLKWNLPVYLTCMLIPCIPSYIPFSYILCGICFVYTKPYIIIIIYISVPVSLSLSPVWLPRGLILQDLTFVHLGNPDTLRTSQGSKVNFSKRWQQFNILDTLRSYQQVSVSEATLSAIPAGQSVCVSTHCVTSLSLQSILSAAKWWHHILLQWFQRSPGRGSIVGTFSQAPPTKCPTIHSELNKLNAKQGMCANQNLRARRPEFSFLCITDCSDIRAVGASDRNTRGKSPSSTVRNVESKRAKISADYWRNVICFPTFQCKEMFWLITCLICWIDDQTFL